MPSMTFSLIKSAEYTIMNIHEDGVIKMDRMYGFIGCGNMASAILGGMLAGGVCAPEQLMVYDVSAEKCETFRQKGVFVAKDAAELVRRCDVVVLAVKPQVYGPVLEGIKDAVDETKILVSIAAGIMSRRPSVFPVRWCVLCPIPRFYWDAALPLFLGVLR